MASTSWTNAAGGDWLTSGDWSGGVPALGIDATISVAGSYTVTLATGEISDAANSLNIANTTATVALEGGAHLAITTNLTNSGILDVDFNEPVTGSTAGGGSLTVTGTLTNSKQVNIGNAGLTTLAVTASFGAITNSGSFSLAGSSGHLTTATVTNAVTNSGTVSVDANSSLTLGSGKTYTQNGSTAVTNVAGTLSATNVTINGGTFSDTGSFTLANNGTIFVAGAGTVATFGSMTNYGGSTLTGGTYKVGAGAALHLPGSVTAFAGNTAVTLNGTSSSAPDIAGHLATIASGTSLNLFSGQDFTGGASLSVAGALTIDATSKLETALTVGSGGVVTDSGTLNGSVTVSSGGTLILAPTYQLGGTVAGDGTSGGSALLELETGTGTGTVTLGGNVSGFSNVKVLGGTWTINSHVANLPGTSLVGDGAGTTLTFTDDSTSLNLANVTKVGTINLANGTDTVGLTSNTLSAGVTLNGGTGLDTVTATGSVNQALTFVDNSGTNVDHFTGSFENDIVKGTAASLTGDSLTGGAGANTVIVTGTAGGALDLSAATQFQTIELAGGDALTIGDTTLSQNVSVIGSATGHDSVTSTASASATKALTYFMGAATGSAFQGGNEIDTIRGTAAAVTGDTLTGSSNAALNTLVLLTGSGGTGVDLSNVSNFDSIYLASSAANNVTVSSTTLTSSTALKPVVIFDGSSGTTLNASAGLAGKFLTFVAGSKLDSFTGGAEADLVKVTAAALILGDVLDGGSTGDANTLTVTTAGTYSLGNVKNFGTINLAGSNTVGVNKSTWGALTGLTIFGTAGINHVTVANDTTNSQTLTYNAGAGSFVSNGAENDTVNIAAGYLTATGTTLAGSSSGSNVLNVTTPNTFTLVNASHFGTINLAHGTNIVAATVTEINGATVTGFNATDANTLNLTGTGPLNLSSVSNIGTFNLSSGGGVNATVGDTTLSRGAVTINDTGTTGSNTVDAHLTTAASSGSTLTYIATLSGDIFKGGAEKDVVKVSTSNAASDTLTGGSNPGNTLMLTTPGSLSLPIAAGITGFGTIDLAAGSSSVQISNTNAFVGGALTINDGTSGNNLIDASTNSTGSATLTYFATSGFDYFAGGAENDVVNVGPVRASVDVLVGGTGSSTLNVTTPGSFTLYGVRGFGQSFSLGSAQSATDGAINLAAGNNSVGVTTGTLFGTLASSRTLGAGPTVTVVAGGTGNNSITGYGAAGESLTYVASGGANTLTTFVAGGESDNFVFTSTGAGLQTIGGFDPTADALGFYTAGGFTLAGSTPTLNVGTTDTVLTGSDFYYNKSDGKLFYTASTKEIAVFGNHANLAAGNLFAV